MLRGGDSDGLEGIDHEIQRFALRQCFDAPPPELLFIVALHGRQKCLGQYDCVLHQICRIKNQTASSCFAMQHGQAMRQTQYPGGRGAVALF